MARRLYAIVAKLIPLVGLLRSEPIRHWGFANVKEGALEVFTEDHRSLS